MPSSSRPYQSKLLRFVLRQWQQGWERQDKTLRQLQSTATWSAQVAVLPIYAMMRAVQRASLALGSEATQSPKTNAPITQVQENVTDLEHSLTAILAYTQQQLSSKQTTQLDISPTGKPTRQTKNLLSNLVSWIRQRRLARDSGSNHTKSITLAQQKPGDVTTARKPSIQAGYLTKRHSSIHQKTSSGLQQQGTTLASALKTRQLVLVNRKNEVFDIFTPQQQTDLQHYINRIMYAYRHTQTIIRRPTKHFSVNTVLAIGTIFVTALPGEFRKAWTQISPGSEPSLPVVRGHQSQPQFRIFYPQTESSATVKAKARRLKTYSSSRKANRHLSSQSPHSFEADINDVSYLEHPLERVLRWIDRVLTWCEHRWQQWLDQRANIG